MEEMSNERLYESFSERFDVLEQLMKMLLINDVLDEKQKEQMENGMGEEVEGALLGLGITDFQFLSMCGRPLALLHLDEKAPLSRIRGVKKEVEGKLPGIGPVFCFPEISGRRRKIFEQENISYGVEDGEIHVFS